MNLIYQGAEAKLYEYKNYVIKIRIPKLYRVPELDSKITKLRTKSEKRILKQLQNKIRVPKIIEDEKVIENMEFNNENTIVMEKIVGKLLKDVIDFGLMKEAGMMIRKLHDLNVVHGDLTTSNFIYDGNSLVLIDFGLSFVTGKPEDKAVDLYVFERAVECLHGNEFIKYFYEGYGDNENVIERLRIVRSRGRKKM